MSRSIAAAPARRQGIPRRGAASRSRRLVFGFIRSLNAAPQLIRTGAAFAWQRRWMRLTLIAAMISLPLLGGGWLWLRQSSFVAVQRVEVSGVHGPEAGAIDTALVAAARQMSTLDVHIGALRAATASFPVVREVRARPRFPHALDVEVIEQLPVAALVVNGTRTAVAADGVVLGTQLLSGSLPSVSGSKAPAPGKHVTGAGLREALTVLGAAPAPFGRLIERVFTGYKGLTVTMRNGLLVYFGDAVRPHAKWLSLARVLADPSSAGAAYVDVRLPARPAAGFPAGVLPPSASTAAATGPSEPTASTESTVASLAAGLTTGTEVASSGEPPAGSSSSSSSSGSASEAASNEKAQSGAGTEAEVAQTPTVGG
jgi:cell division protein FtsQ